MHLRQRITIVFLLGLTLVTGGVATAKLIRQILMSATDITGGVFQVALMFSVEAMFIIVFGSMPVLKPLWESCLSISQSARRTRLLGPTKESSKEPSLGSSNKHTVVSEFKYDHAHMRANGWLQADNMELARLTGYPAQPAAVVQGGEELQNEQWSERRVQGQIYVHQQLYQDVTHQ